MDGLAGIGVGAAWAANEQPSRNAEIQHVHAMQARALDELEMLTAKLAERLASVRASRQERGGTQAGRPADAPIATKLGEVFHNNTVRIRQVCAALAEIHETLEL